MYLYLYVDMYLFIRISRICAISSSLRRHHHYDQPFFQKVSYFFPFPFLFLVLSFFCCYKYTLYIRIHIYVYFFILYTCSIGLFSTSVATSSIRRYPQTEPQSHSPLHTPTSTPFCPMLCHVQL